MNCLLEAVAGAYLTMRARIMAEPVEEQVYSAQDGLESCKRNMEAREAEFHEEARRLCAAALAAKNSGNRAGARAKVLERRRVLKRLDKLRHGLGLVDAQIEAIRMSELNREIMESLRASTTAMKKAGIGAAIEDAEHLLGEVDDQLRETQDLTTALAAPLGMTEEEEDLDAELQWLDDAGQSAHEWTPRALVTPALINTGINDGPPEAEAGAGRGGDEPPDELAHPALPGV